MILQGKFVVEWKDGSEVRPFRFLFSFHATDVPILFCLSQ
jgi:hypothetical protein